MKRIVHFTSGHAPTDTRVFLKECRSLARAGYDVTLVYPGKIAQSEVDGVKLVGTGIHPKGRWYRILRTPAQIYRTALSLNADIYHFHDPALLPYALKLKHKGKTVIYDSHEDVPRQTLSKEYLNKAVRPLLAWSLEHLEDYASKKFDAVIAATPTIASRFRKLGVTTEVVANFPMREEFATDVVQHLREARTICHIGGQARMRGFREMIEALSSVEGVTLLLAGPRPNDELRSLVSHLPGWSRAVELGEVNRDGIRSVLQRSRAGLVLFHPVPNHIEALPNKMFEYMAAGVPVICSNFPLWREIIEANECGICIDPQNPQAVAEAIRFIIDNPEKASLMGARGRALVDETLNWSREERKLLNLYAKLAEVTKTKSSGSQPLANVR